MARQARLDAPDTLHHVMVRGIARTTVFRDDPERADFLARHTALATSGALTVYTWALLANHAHLRVHTGNSLVGPSSRSTRKRAWWHTIAVFLAASRIAFPGGGRAERGADGEDPSDHPFEHGGNTSPTLTSPPACNTLYVARPPRGA